MLIWTKDAVPIFVSFPGIIRKKNQRSYDIAIGIWVPVNILKFSIKSNN